MAPTVVHLPALRALVRHGAAHLLETALFPVGIFYLVLLLQGFAPAVLAAMAWAVATIAIRALFGRRIPALLLITTGVLAGRTVLGLATGSEVLYFLQPALQNFLLALLLLLSTRLRRPVLGRLAADVCSFPDRLAADPRMGRYFRQVSILWAAVFLLVGAVTLTALLTTAIGDYLLLSNLAYYSLVGLGIALSLVWFRRSLRDQRIVLRLGQDPAARAA